MYMTTRRYRTGSGASEDLKRHLTEGFLPIIGKVPGFVAYYYVDAGNGVAISVSVFEDRAGAEESTRLAADYIRKHLASFFPNPPEITAGEVVAHRTAGRKAGAA